MASYMAPEDILQPEPDPRSYILEFFSHLLELLSQFVIACVFVGLIDTSLPTGTQTL